MKIDMTDLLNSITENLKRIDYIKPEEIPNIDLYMDQVTTFMDEHLADSLRAGVTGNPQTAVLVHQLLLHM